MGCGDDPIRGGLWQVGDGTAVFGVIQAHDDQIGFESAGNAQDGFTVLPKFDHQFGRHRGQGTPRNKLAKPLKSRVPGIRAQLDDVARGARPTKTFGDGHDGSDMKQGQLGLEMIGKCERVG